MYCICRRVSHLKATQTDYICNLFSVQFPVDEEWMLIPSGIALIFFDIPNQQRMSAYYFSTILPNIRNYFAFSYDTIKQAVLSDFYIGNKHMNIRCPEVCSCTTYNDDKSIQGGPTQ